MKVNLRTRKLHEVRKDGLIPGVMYGKSIESTSIEVNEKDFKESLNQFGKSMTFVVTLDGKKHNVYIKTVQSNILRPDEIVHFELHRIAKDETISASIPVDVLGKEELAKKRLYVQMGLTDIACEYAVGAGLSIFEFDATDMEVDAALYVKDIEVPEGMVIKEDLEQMVFIIREAHEVEEDEEETADVDGEATAEEEASEE
ncbi:MAG: 50S ribosomal protein L25 [Acholeplasmataceae bacterium]|nr:50S ribosomal protein L25 [Acholeplasmataceae bacterium]